MIKKGNHTWDIIIDYVKCPHCHYITENRQSYVKRGKEYVKECMCPRCKQSFTVKRQKPLEWTARLLD